MSKRRTSLLALGLPGVDLSRGAMGRASEFHVGFIEVPSRSGWASLSTL